MAKKKYTIEQRNIQQEGGCLYELLDSILWFSNLIPIDIITSLFRYVYYRKRLGFIEYLKQSDDNKLIIYQKGTFFPYIKEMVYEEVVPEAFSEFELADIYDRLQKQVENGSIEDTLRKLQEGGATFFGIQGTKIRLD